MKKFLLILCGLIVTVVSMAVPAKPGLWRMLPLADGTEIRACLCGDEHVHFWLSEDGRRFVASGNVYVPIDKQQLQSRLMSRRAAMRPSSRLLSPKRVAFGDRTHYFGKKKGIVFLVQYSDVKFKTANNLEKYKRILNEPGYSEGYFKGSVGDYFKEQSAGQFELEFDVLGPITLKYSQSYYGANSDVGDARAEEMVIEACSQADSLVNFRDYDWDGDGEVDQVFVVYAGKGESDGGSANTVWPHMDRLLDLGRDSLKFDGVLINTYACSNEVDASGRISGIGTFCHEFSHCLGFPDFYDITYSGVFGMGEFDLMAAGSSCGNGFTPVGYTAHEKMMCGWQEPIVLDSLDVDVDNILPMSNHGQTYVIYNNAWPNEYFMIENRQKTGFDSNYPAKGLLITHVDFDKLVWEENVPNTIVTERMAWEYDMKTSNDHQRMTLLHADNNDDSQYWNPLYEMYYAQTLSTDLYPYRNNDSVTARSTPAPILFHPDKNGKKTVEWAITDIRQNDDGTMSFCYRAPGSKHGMQPQDTTATDSQLFYESFNNCSGTGGNDGLWSGSVAAADFKPDNSGWTVLSDKAYGAAGCAKFGTSSIPGVATTPVFTLNGEAVLTFKASAWNTATESTTLLVEADNATIEPSVFDMEKSKWQDYQATVKGTGLPVRITFTPGRRFFLDEVLVMQSPELSGIQVVRALPQEGRIYTLDGRYVGTDVKALSHGLYIVNGKKIIK